MSSLTFALLAILLLATTIFCTYWRKKMSEKELGAIWKTDVLIVFICWVVLIGAYFLEGSFLHLLHLVPSGVWVW